MQCACMCGTLLACAHCVGLPARFAIACFHCPHKEASALCEAKCLLFCAVFISAGSNTEEGGAQQQEQQQQQEAGSLQEGAEEGAGDAGSAGQLSSGSPSEQQAGVQQKAGQGSSLVQDEL